MSSATPAVEKNNAFADELRQIDASMKKEVADEIKETEENAKLVEKVTTEVKDSLLDVIIKEGGPSKSQVEEWKTMYGGKVFAVRFDEKDSFIFRCVTRTEYKAIMLKMTKTQGATEDMFDEAIFEKCVLFPAMDHDAKLMLPAGTVPTVSSQIKVASNFIPDAVAFDMITKL